MVALPKSETVMIEQIYNAIEKTEKSEFRLTRIGASGIGNECLRATWLSWRGYAASTFDGRMYRLFRTGHLQEDRIVADLRAAGFEVWSHQEDGEQYTYNDATGHFVAKLDGVIRGVPSAEKTPHDLEIKTHSKKSFTEVEKKGVQLAKTGHYYQMQAGMLFSKLPRALYVALCKDNEQYYVERVKPDEQVMGIIQRRINTLVEAELIPAGVSDDGGAFACKWCDMRAACIGEVEPIRTCRSCVNAVVIPEGGAWGCARTGEILSSNDQLMACGEYEVKAVSK
jgi:hypothetical protein